MREEFSLTIRHSSAESHIVVAGELDVLTGPKLNEALAMVVATHPATLWVDAQKVRLLTSSGLEPLITWGEVCRSRGIEMRVLLSAQARRVVEVLGCAALLEPVTPGTAIDGESSSMAAWLET